MNTRPRNLELNLPAGSTSTSAAGRFVGWAMATAFTASAGGLFALGGFGAAGAKEPIEVVLRPDAATVLAPAAAGAAKGAGTLKGVVTFKGTIPDRKVIVRKGDASIKDAPVCAAEEHLSEALLVNEKAGNGVANVFVYMKKAPTDYKVPPVPKEPVVFDQKGCHFIPHALTVRTKQTVLVKSGDNLVHNTHSHPLRSMAFNQAIKADDREGVAFSYDKPEPLPTEVVCDFHTWMKAYHLALDHPFMAVTDDEGKFEIGDLPAGKHVFVVWHEQGLYLNRELAVEIKADQTTEEKLSYTAAQFKVGK